jgi:hypothetical protein
VQGASDAGSSRCSSRLQVGQDRHPRHGRSQMGHQA